MSILFIHQNFPGQFKFRAPTLAQQDRTVMAMAMQKTGAKDWQGVRLVPYNATEADLWAELAQVHQLDALGGSKAKTGEQIGEQKI